jgi:hypothetical protein
MSRRKSLTEIGGGLVSQRILTNRWIDGEFVRNVKRTCLWQSKSDVDLRSGRSREDEWGWPWEF